MGLQRVEHTQTSGANAPGAITAIVSEDRYYRPELDWLRFLAFCLVFMMHSFARSAEGWITLGVPAVVAEWLFLPVVDAGGYGVDLFFALSSFLITQLLLLERDRTGSVHIRSFYVRRILRIWPLYFVVVGAGAIIELGLLYGPEGRAMYYLSLMFFVSNWYHALYSIPTIKIGTSHLWSISIEEQFYVVWPLLLAWAPRRRFVGTLVGIFLFTGAYRALIIYRAWPDTVELWCNTLAHLDAFALGGLLACWQHWRGLSLQAAWRAAFIVCAVGIYWLLGSLPFAGYFSYFPIYSYPLAAIASTLCIAAFCGGPRVALPGRIQRVFSYLGKISYGLYVFHLPVIYFVDALFIDEAGLGEWQWVAQSLVSGAVTVAMSAVSYRVLEKPFLKLKRRFTFVQSRPE